MDVQVNNLLKQVSQGLRDESDVGLYSSICGLGFK